jgi:hypothetical protein
MLRTLLALSALAAAPLAAQSMGDMPAMPHHDAHATAPLSATARQQIAAVARAAKPLGTTEAARSAGFAPVFGWLPTMGVHWVDRAHMTKADQTDRTHPGQLMFSRVAGKDSLVGAAYGYFTEVTDSARPALFDGAPPWHEHPDLAPPGQRLLMLHVWFVPSPDGPFAGTNPNLPFWAVGLAAPDSTRIRTDATYSSTVRRAALALAEVADTAAIFPLVQRRAEVRAVLVPRRDSIRLLIAELKAAQTAHDAPRVDRALDRTAAQWDAIYAASLASARTADGKARMERYAAMLMGRHE